MAAYFQQISPCWVASGMTPVVQLADTDIAFPLKRKIDKFKEELVSRFKSLALANAREVSFKMGPRELIEVISWAHREFKVDSEARKIVLAGLRRNGQLAYTTRSGKMEKITVENSPRVAGLPDIGSHR